jgi:hypothetical protein
VLIIHLHGDSEPQACLIGAPIESPDLGDEGRDGRVEHPPMSASPGHNLRRTFDAT